MSDELLAGADKFYAESINEARLSRRKAGYIDIIFILVLWNYDGKIGLMGSKLPRMSLRLYRDELLDDRDLMATLLLDRVAIAAGIEKVDVFDHGPGNIVLVQGNGLEVMEGIQFVHYTAIQGYDYDVAIKAIKAIMSKSSSTEWLSLIYD